MPESFAELLLWGQKVLTNSKISYTELLQVLAHCNNWENLAQGSGKLLGQSKELASPKLCKDYHRAIENLAEGQALEYILGFADFAGYRFAVGPGVLIPREDSEILLEQGLFYAQQLVQQNKSEYKVAWNILDLCCGSFCIGLSWYLKCIAEIWPSIAPSIAPNMRPDIRLWGSDVSEQALHYAKINREKLLKQENVELIHSDLFAKIEHKYQMIFANPPYLSEEECERRSSWREPRLALAAGADGLGLLRKIIQESPFYLDLGGFLLLEAAPWQMHELKILLQRRGFSQIELHCDAAGHERVISSSWV